MIRVRTRRALLAASLVLPALAAEAQQVLVPAAPRRPVAQPAVEWPATNRAAQVIERQVAARPAAFRAGGLGGAEATRIYRNFLEGLGRPLETGSAGSYGPSSDSGSGGTGSSSGRQP